MAIYDQFAEIYQRGPYVRFAQGLAESVLPEYLSELGLEPSNLLDVACGEGTFALMMSRLGYDVVGVDQSPEMIRLARKQAWEEKRGIEFLVEDMRALPFEAQFDLVTCLFDSLNYMLTIQDLSDAFMSVYRALRPDGLFIFDMNTIYGLAVDWMRQETYIQNEAPDFIELHRQSFDYENLVATMTITIFRQRGKTWQRIEETHRERGYPVADIQFLLHEIGFEVVGMFGNLKKRSALQTTSPRVYFAARKHGAGAGA